MDVSAIFQISDSKYSIFSLFSNLSHVYATTRTRLIFLPGLFLGKNTTWRVTILGSLLYCIGSDHGRGDKTERHGHMRSVT